MKTAREIAEVFGLCVDWPEGKEKLDKVQEMIDENGSQIFEATKDKFAKTIAKSWEKESRYNPETDRYEVMEYPKSLEEIAETIKALKLTDVVRE